MALTTRPAILYGTAEAIASSPWTSTSTPTVTAGQGDPIGGTDAVRIQDSSAGAPQGRLKTLPAVAGSRLDLIVFARQVTATSSAVQVYDTTGTAYAIQASAAWSGGVATWTASTGTVIAQWNAGSGYYGVLLTCSWTSGNIPRLELYGAGATASATGITDWYVRNIVLLDYMGEDTVAYDGPRPGSDTDRGASGVETAWDAGDDYFLEGTLRSIPATNARTSPVLASGWVGANESVGVNCSVSAMLRAGRKKQALTFCPDYTSLLLNPVSCYLNEPMQPKPTPMADLTDLTLPIKLIALSAFAIA